MKSVTVTLPAERAQSLLGGSDLVIYLTPNPTAAARSLFRKHAATVVVADWYPRLPADLAIHAQETSELAEVPDSGVIVAVDETVFPLLAQVVSHLLTLSHRPPIVAVVPPSLAKAHLGDLQAAYAVWDFPMPPPPELSWPTTDQVLLERRSLWETLSLLLKGV